MATWTKTPQEYSHVRSIIVDGPIYGRVTVLMKDGQLISGLLTGSNSGNNIAENMNAGLGPVVSSIWGEIRVQLADGKMVTLDALEISHVTPNSN
jgi:hypothetical protein